MRVPRVRFTLGRMMVAVGTVALLLAASRVAVVTLPHIRRCWALADNEQRISRAYRLAASRYRSCARAVPCTPSDYCYNSCLAHASAAGVKWPPADDKQRSHADDEHRLAADRHEHAAGLHAARASLYRRAAFRPSQPPPAWTYAEERSADVFRDYRCDLY